MNVFLIFLIVTTVWGQICNQALVVMGEKGSSLMDSMLGSACGRGVPCYDQQTATFFVDGAGFDGVKVRDIARVYGLSVAGVVYAGPKGSGQDERAMLGSLGLDHEQLVYAPADGADLVRSWVRSTVPGCTIGLGEAVQAVKAFHDSALEAFETSSGAPAADTVQDEAFLAQATTAAELFQAISCKSASSNSIDEVSKTMLSSLASLSADLRLYHLQRILEFHLARYSSRAWELGIKMAAICFISIVYMAFQSRTKKEEKKEDSEESEEDSDEDKKED